MRLRFSIVCFVALAACGTAEGASGEATIVETAETSAPTTEASTASTTATTTAPEATTTTKPPTPGCATFQEIVDLDAAFDPEIADAAAFDVYFAEAVRLRERLQDELPNRSSLNALGATGSAEFIANIHASTGHDLTLTGKLFRETRSQGVDLTSGESAIVIYAETRCDLEMAPLHAIFPDE